MDFMRMRVAETELSLEESATGVLRVVRRYRPVVLVREAVRGLIGGLVSVAVFTALGGALGREWAIVLGGIAVCGWTLGVIALVRNIGLGGPVSKVADLPSRWTGLPTDAEAAVFRWALLEALIQEEEAGDRKRALQQRTEAASSWSSIAFLYP